MTNVRVADIEGVCLTGTNVSSDSRGSFIKIHPFEKFKQSLDSVAVSTNPSLGTIRGMHFQIEPFAEEKIISCIQGSIHDVIVDIRPQSQTFGKWAAFELSAKNRLQAYLPKGVAHGFQTLEPDTIIQYCLSASYSSDLAYSINPLGDLQIDWPLKDFLISEKDSGGISLSIAAYKYAKSLES
jgi:dTDP-4-dehydrorhamnose 3,5-epimerase